MGDKILVGYASWVGSTEGVAQAIGKTLRESSGGATVEVLPLKQVSDPTAYRAVVLGSAVRAGRLHNDLPAFVKRHATALSSMPVAYFVVCLTMKDNTEANCREVSAYLDPLYQNAPTVKPREVGLFAGALDYGKLSLIPSLILKAMKSPAGDFRDWDAIRAWSERLAPQLRA